MELNVFLYSGMVDSLIIKTLAWEDEKQKLFLYDGVSSPAATSFQIFSFVCTVFQMKWFLCVGEIGVDIGGLQNG